MPKEYRDDSTQDEQWSKEEESSHFYKKDDINSPINMHTTEVPIEKIEKIVFMKEDAQRELNRFSKANKIAKNLAVKNIKYMNMEYQIKWIRTFVKKILHYLRNKSKTRKALQQIMLDISG